MRACLERGHSLAPAAVERLFEAQRRDPDLLRRELVEDPLSVVGAVEAVRPRVIAADDEMGAAVVLADDGVEDRLARSGEAHHRGEYGEQRPFSRVVLLDEDLVAAEAYVSRYVRGAGLAEKRLYETAVEDFESRLQNELVGAVDRIARLEADHGAPSLLPDERPRHLGVEMVRGEFDPDRAPDDP